MGLHGERSECLRPAVSGRQEELPTVKRTALTLDVAMPEARGVAGMAHHSDRLAGCDALANMHKACGHVPVVDVVAGERAAGDADDG
jgi:hypothetical protein